MTSPALHTPSITLDHVTFQLPNGTLLFDALNERFDSRRTGLVGHRLDWPSRAATRR